MDSAVRQGTLTFHSFRLELRTGELFREGIKVRLEEQALRTLLALIEDPGELVSREQIRSRLWPHGINVDFDHGVDKAVNKLREALGDDANNPRFIETLKRRGYRFLAPICAVAACGGTPDTRGRIRVGNGTTAGSIGEAQITGGALPPESSHYVTRDADEALERSLVRPDSIVLLSGSRQVGKSSMVARACAAARAGGLRLAISDFQRFTAEQMRSSDSILLSLACELAEQLGVKNCPFEDWDQRRPSSLNLERFFRHHILPGDNERLIWILDECDRLLSSSCGADVFGVFRSWHNARAFDQTSPWSKLTLVLVHSSEPHLFIGDSNQSPFNVGTRLELSDFDLAASARLVASYNCCVQGAAVGDLMSVLGGHPFLLHRATQSISSGECEPARALSIRTGALFENHLRQMALFVSGSPSLRRAAKDVIGEHRIDGIRDFYQLRSYGVITGSSPGDARIRCNLYRDYLQTHLS